MVDVGDGDLDYRRFLAEVGRLPGRRGHHWLVERDDAVDPEANPAGSLTTARRSAAYLRALRTGCGGRSRGAPGTRPRPGDLGVTLRTESDTS